jgi:uncharacterized protein YkwD
MTDLRTRCHTALALLATLLVPAAAGAEVIDSVNALRNVGCDGRHPGAPPLRENARLDEAAHRLSQGTDLRTALQSAGYHEVSSFSVSISNVPPSGDIERTLARQFCQQVTNPAFHEMGTWRRGGTVWIALAQPFAPPAPHDLGDISRRVLALTNEARSHSRRCGAAPYAAAPPLASSATLAQVALAYARDMATWSYMDHTGHDGSTPAQRITRGGYRWSEVGENLASGVMTAEEVVAGWLASPEHCVNLMDPRFRQVGVAFAVNPHDRMGVYWAMEFGTPR